MNRRSPPVGSSPPAARPDGADLPEPHPPGDPGDDLADARQSLIPVIRSDVLPSLHAKFGAVGGPALPDDRELAQEDLAEFVQALTASDMVGAEQVVERLRRAGARPEWIVLNLFSGAARHLGERWEQDRSDFVEVTIAMSHLSGLMRDFAEHLLPVGRPVGSPCRMLLSPVPGEEHTFGLNVVAEFLVRAGFEVCVRTAASAEALVASVREASFDAVGLSLSSERLLDGLDNLIRQVRCASPNKGTAVVVGGGVFARSPALWRTVGADLHLSDVREAPIRILRLVRLRARRYGRA